MDSIQDELNPLPSSWFLTDVEYDGHGYAKFDEPKGILSGNIKIRFLESGDSIVEMQIEQIENEKTLQFGLFEFLSGEKKQRTEKGYRFDFTGSSNPCITLTVKTTEGVFSSTKNIRYGYSLEAFPNDKPAKLRFHLIRSIFEASNENPAQYWVFPLLNFLSEFDQNHPTLDRHPLRIYPTPSIAEKFEGESKPISWLRANSKNRLIIFEFKDRLGFIEALPDYEARKNKLISGQEQSIITAVMVGEIEEDIADEMKPEEFLPADFLLLLGFATGSEVGAPWIELRDAGEQLVRRFHSKLSTPVFSNGRTIIREHIHRGTGHLLTQSQFSLDFGKAHFRVALKHLLLEGRQNLSIENKLSHLFRAFDALCEAYGISKTSTLSDFLGEEITNKVQDAIKQAVGTISGLAKTTDKKTESELLMRIASQISGAKYLRVGFGKAIVALMEKFGLHDASIIAKHYDDNPRSDRKKWPEVLSSYRGISIHRGYFEFEEGNHDMEDVIRIMFHLHDILVRIILKMLGYNGTYQPIVIKGTTDQFVDWVTPDTPASRLGY